MRKIANAAMAGIVTVAALASTGCLAKSRHGTAQVANVMQRGSCPVTTPNGLQLPPEMKQTRSPYLHGNGKLWTTLPLNGILVLTLEKDGSLGEKFPWWKSVTDQLTIEGRRLDGPGTLKANIPSGYGPTFQSTAVFFSDEGCWLHHVEKPLDGVFAEPHVSDIRLIRT